MSQDKEIRALYLKGIIPGKKARIELAVKIGGRNAASEYVALAQKGDIVDAEMSREGWIVKLADSEVLIPLANGRLRQ